MVNQMINREIMNLLREKSHKSSRTIYKMIEQRQKDHAVNRETAAHLLAMEYDINIAKYLTEEELAKVREIKSPIIVRERSIPSKAIARSITVRIEPEIDVEVSNLPPKVIREAKEMAHVYPYIYLFENSVRYLIKEILEKKYGDNWWEDLAPSDAKREVSKRMAKEDIHRWHARRGEHPIFYTDMHNLYSIIVKNWDDFKDMFPDQDWVKSRVEEIELSRNIVAHNNPLPKDERTRLKLDLKAWVKQVSK